MGPAQAIRTCLGNYVTFSGRASRSEFWWFWSLLTGLTLALSAVGLEAINGLLSLATLLPMLAVTWRRMHDADSSGAVVLLPFLAMIAAVYIQLFAMLGPIHDQLEKLKFGPDTTLAQMEEQLAKAATEGGANQTPPVSVLAVLVSGAAAIWLIYLLARPSSLGPNRFGLPPGEIAP
jgi:uncharacterized membrane protein YhaH (DUF805 family)